MKITKRQLRRIIKETLSRPGSTFDQKYNIVDKNISYPYGRNRGDVRATIVYEKVDGSPIDPIDLEMLRAEEEEKLKKHGMMAKLLGVYKSHISADGMQLIRKYEKHTAG